ncbi:GNAT family N-acetyltransferase [Pontibacter sp. BAB1700]|uniref:GNAT family N-acetyltransferase n=1 Tax=Pontibacter sp. BAB1700 TaxID=1144253 RepID=UPI00026BD149|nr:GNAT family N-acetyltransferase [Pontibacter sp. BAB1700]EJF11889.1 N-acetyltransferase GCN5 [Pontibacter sp. BAB1700]
MSITIRKIAPADAGALASLSQQFGYNVSAEEMEQRIGQVLARKEHCGFVAIKADQIVGWIHGFHTFRLESEPFVEIGGLVVDQNFRRQGIGQQLVHKVNEWAADQSVGRLRVRCHTARTDTHVFYQKTGFTESKEQKVFDMPVTLQ